MKKVFFPGSFNPFTKGHADIARRLASMADSVVVGIGVNIRKPETKAEAEANAAAIRRWAKDAGLEDKIEVTVYDGLTAEEAVRHGASLIARGVRSAADFEYEFALASANRDAFGIETVLIPADPGLSFVSSTMMRDLIYHGRKDIAKKYLP